MKHSIKHLVLITFGITIAACSNNQNSLAGKKAALQKLKTEQNTLTEKIKNLEEEIAKLDTTVAKEDIAKLVGVTTLTTQNFVHYIDLQGHVDADNISYISPRLGPGQVKAIYVKKGDFVKRGQLLLKLDDAIIRQSVTAAKQNLETLKTQLSYAKDLYNRQNNLWKQGIGTEIQLLTAKNNVAILEDQLATAEQNVKTIQEQANATNVYSDVDGIADEVNIRVGETFSGVGPSGAQIKIVNTSTLKVVTDVPENYTGKVKVGSKVVINITDLNKTYNSTISLVSKVISANNRSFTAEAKLPYDGLIRPNQLAEVKIEDYSASNAITIPVNTLQTDEKGKFVYVAVKEGNKMIARKKQIVVGEVYGASIEVKNGLASGDMLITEGFQSVYDGQSIKTL